MRRDSFISSKSCLNEALHSELCAPFGFAFAFGFSQLYSYISTFHIPSDAGPAPLAVGPDGAAPPGEEKGDGDEEDGEAAEDGVAPVDADVVVHGADEEGEGAGEEGAEEHVGGDGAGAVAREGVDEVVERGLEDGGEADAREEDADDGGPVVHFGVGGPWAVVFGVSCCCSCCCGGRRRGGLATRGGAGSHPNTKSPTANNTPPIIIGGSRASGTGRFPLARKSWKYCLLL